MADKTWTEERIAQLAKLWEEGLSATACGRKLGCSKNAVIGITHRKGPEMFSRRKPSPKHSYKRKPRPNPKSKPKPAPLGVLPLFPVIEGPPEPGVDIMGISDQRCRYPLEGRLKPPYRFCGEPVIESPYCPAHRELCYQPWRKAW